MEQIKEKRNTNLFTDIIIGILKKCASYTFFVVIITIIVGIMSSDFMDIHKIPATLIISILVIAVFISDYFFDI